MMYGLAYITGMMTIPDDRHSQTSYGEKVAWVSLLVTLVLYVPFFVYAFRWLAHAQGTIQPLGLLPVMIGVVVLQAVLMPLGLLAWWLTGQRAPQEKADERDRSIDARATRAAYITLITAGFFLVFSLPFRPEPGLQSTWALMTGGLFCFVLAEVVRFAMQIVGYRRGY